MKARYHGVILDDTSRSKILQTIKVPQGWEPIADHMTIGLGPSMDKTILGKQVELSCVSLANDDKAMALTVTTDVPSCNAVKHITVAVNREAGGKPVHSRNLTNYQRITPFTVSGTIQEVF